MKKYIYTKNLLKVIFITLVIPFYCTNINAQRCLSNNANGSATKMSLNTSRANKISSNAIIVINIYFNVLNANYSSNVTEQECKDALVRLNGHYSSANIAFRFNGYRNYYNNPSATINNQVELINTRNINTNTTNLQVFLVNNITIGTITGVLGWAELPGDYIVLDKTALDTFVFAHEIGHNLNLLHTFHGQAACEFNPSIPAEAANGFNCDTAGDLVCDTPADPCMNQATVNAACNFTGSTAFNPDTRNIMSYTRLECGSDFTQGQANRLRESLVLLNELQAIQTPARNLAKYLDIDRDRSNYSRVSIGGGCFSISYLETKTFKFQKGFNYNITVQDNNFSGNISMHRFSALETPIVDVVFNNYTIISTITDSSPFLRDTQTGSTGFVNYIDCPIWFPLFSSSQNSPIQSSIEKTIKPGLYAVPIKSKDRKEVIEKAKVIVKE